MAQDRSRLFKYDELLEMKTNTLRDGFISGMNDNDLLFYKQTSQILYNFFDSMQLTTKKLCNSIYGGLGTPSLRYFNHNVANDITTEARNVCQLCERVGQHYFTKIWHVDYDFHKELSEHFPHFINENTVFEPIVDDVVITCDTDSNYITFDLVFKSIGFDPRELTSKEATDFIVYFMQKRLDPIYANILERHIVGRNGQNHMIFELEAVGGFGIFVAKKMYVYAKLWEDGKYIAEKGKLKVTGLDIKRSASSKKVKSIIETVINYIFIKKGIIDSSIFFSLCNSIKSKLAHESVDDISKATTLRKYDEYVINDTDKVEVTSRCPFAVRGSARYNKFIKDNNLIEDYPLLKNDMFIKVYYDIEGLPFAYPTDYGCPPNAPKFSLDIQLEKMVFSPIRRLITGMVEGDLNKMGAEKYQSGFNNILSKFNKTSDKKLN